MNGSMNDGVLLAEFEECQKKVLLADVDVVLGSIFGRELLDGFKTVHKFLSDQREDLADPSLHKPSCCRAQPTRSNCYAVGRSLQIF